MKDFRGKKVLVIGAARQGTALARFLSTQGASVILNDGKPPEQLAEIAAQMAELPVQICFGEHPLTLLENCDLVCVSGGVPLTLPIILEAQKRAIPLSNDSQIFFERLHARSIGITGSAGKTTTTTLVGEIARQACRSGQKAWVGGNIGTPLINDLNAIQPADIVVLELSSFQLELMTISPTIAAITNITPNHLDRHGSMQAYTQAKAHILDYQTAENIAVLNREDTGAWDLHPSVRGKLISFGVQAPDASSTGTFLQDDQLCINDHGQVQPLCKIDCIHLAGIHNIMNALAASAIAFAAGFPSETIRAGIDRVKGIPHRLEFVRRWHGADWYNDSIATAPERTMAAIHSFEQPLVLLLGGRDKKLPWEELAAEIHQRARHIVLFGEAADMIENILTGYEQGQLPYTLEKYASMPEAVQAVANIVKKGDVVLLSPGCTSYDAYKDFEERGDLFKQIVESFA